MKNSPFVAIVLVASVLFSASSVLADATLTKPAFLIDPLHTEKTLAKTPVKGMLPVKDAAEACALVNAKKQYSLQEVLTIALCHNPTTRQTWATAKARAAELGASRSGYLPTISGSAPLSWQDTHIDGAGGTTHERTFNTTISVNYLLFDFSREATVENFRQQLKAANWGQDAALQDVLLSAFTAYYQLFSLQEAVESNKQAEAYSLENLKAATARLEVGVATLADKLQAETAYAQATLNRVRSEGDARVAMGNLANVMGLEADAEFAVVPPEMAQPDAKQELGIKALIEQAMKARPDMREAEAQVKAARANVQAVRGEGLPSLSLVGGYNTARSTMEADRRGSVIGVTASFPLFSGFNIHYRTQAARALLENQIALRDQVKNQVALDVWSSYYNLETEREALKASAALLKSATESEKVARERYKAGVGDILELLNAETELANARLQHIQSRYNWYIAKATLARALGVLKL